MCLFRDICTISTIRSEISFFVSRVTVVKRRLVHHSCAEPSVDFCLTIILQTRVFYERIVKEAQPR